MMDENMNDFFIRISTLLLGLLLYGLGLTLSIHANIGLAPWDAFSIGISGITGISYGIVSMLTGIIILIVVVAFLKEKIGIATILNTIFVGIFVDILQSFNIIPYMTNFLSGIIMLLTGQVIICLATYFYIKPGFGCGPRDTLMVALGKLLPKVPIGAIRGSIEGIVLIIGWLLGAKVGLGTIIAVFGIGFIMQMTFKLLHFEVRTVIHESLFETIAYFKDYLVNSKKEKSNVPPL